MCSKRLQGSMYTSHHTRLVDGEWAGKGFGTGKIIPKTPEIIR